MADEVSTIIRISDVLSDTLSAYTENIRLVVADVSAQLSDLALPVSQSVLITLVGLIDDILDLYPSEWILVQQSIRRLTGSIETLIVDKVRGVNDLLAQFTTLNKSLVTNFSDQLAVIDDVVTRSYNARMFALYDRVSEVSLAIGAPPAYLEEIIQNARIFVLSVSSSLGLEYYDVLWAWDLGFQRLLTLISNSVSKYRENPQWIKIDVENMVIKPLYDIKVLREKESALQKDLVEKVLVELKNLLVDQRITIQENKQAVSDIFPLLVEPAIKQIRDDWDFWLDGIYYPVSRNTSRALEVIRDRQTEFGNIFGDIIRRLGMAGDIIESIHDLPFDDRIEQLGKLVDTTIAPIVAVGQEFTKQLRTKTAEAEKRRQVLAGEQKGIDNG